MATNPQSDQALEEVAPASSIVPVNAELLPTTRNRRGQFLPGQTGNRKGRTRGTPNRATRLAAQRMARQADRVAKAMVDIAINHPDAYARLNAGRVVLERAFAEAARLDAANAAAQDTEWVNWSTDRELRIIHRLIERAQARMEAGASQFDPPPFTSLPAPTPAIPFASPKDAGTEPEPEAEVEVVATLEKP